MMVNWLEQEAARNQQRVDKIRRNPDPTKARSNELLYELERDLRLAEIKAWREGSPPIVGTVGLIKPLMKSLGLQPLNYSSAADKQMIADHYVDVTTAEGFPEKCCDRTLALLGLVAKGDLPRPRFVVTTNAGCDPIYLAGIAMAQRFGVPHYVVDVPLEEDESALAYVAEQLRDLIATIERTVPGATYDEDKLVHLHDLNRQALACLHDVYELRRLRPCPVPRQDIFRLPRLPAAASDPERMLAYHRAYRDELLAKASQLGDVEEKLRVMWTCSAPYFADPFAVLERKGARIVVFQFDIVARYMAKIDPSYGDEQYGRRLSPLEEEARMLFSCSWVGKGTRWIDHVLQVAADLGVEAIVNFVQIGCTATVGLGTLIAEGAERELGVPTLNIEGRQMVERDYNKDAFEATLEQFIDVCLARKAARTG